MSVGDTFLVIITASFLKPLLSSNESLSLPSVSLYDKFPFDEYDMHPQHENDLFLTPPYPQSIQWHDYSDVDLKRQFDPWGGKRLSIPTRNRNAPKRQFSPWGGKRSYPAILSWKMKENEKTDSRTTNTISFVNKKSFNSWNSKEGFNSRGEKRNFAEGEAKKVFKTWEDKRNLKIWNEKRNFNAWGGKRFFKDPTKASVASYSSDDNSKLGGKRQAFNSWGGKRMVYDDIKATVLR